MRNGRAFCNVNVIDCCWNCFQANGPDPDDPSMTDPNSITTTTTRTTTTSVMTTTCRSTSSGRRGRSSSCGSGSNVLSLLWTLEYPVNHILHMFLLLLAASYYVYFWIMVNHLRKELLIPIPVFSQNPVAYPQPTFVGPQPMIL